MFRSKWTFTMEMSSPRDQNDENGNHIVFQNTANKEGPCGPAQYGYNGITELSLDYRHLYGRNQ